MHGLETGKVAAGAATDVLSLLECGGLQYRGAGELGRAAESSEAGTAKLQKKKIAFFRPTQKIAWDGPKWDREVLFPANPDLADILGNTDFDFENL